MQEAVPQTMNYMLAGYTVLLGLPALYVLSWWWRRRRYEQDLAVLRSLQSGTEPDDNTP